MNDSEKLLEELQRILAELGWDAFINIEDPYCVGMVIGTKEFIAKIADGEEDFSNYDMLVTDSDGEVLH